jgi:tetratricopeptide (TPR) repeat protein
MTSRKQPPAPTLSQPKIRLNRRELDSSCHRLSRVPHKYTLTKASKSETSGSFAPTYYSENPLDTRPPPEKLSEIESRLQENPPDSEKFPMLVQKKSLCQLIYGELSREAIRAMMELGAFYNQQDKPDSAARNLTKASQGASEAELEPEDQFTIAVELADANLNACLSTTNKLEKAKQVAVADTTLSPFAEYESDNKMNCFRRDLYLGRIRKFRMKWPEALAFYEKAIAAYRTVHAADVSGEEEEGSDRWPEEANICVEAAQVAEHIPDCDRAPALYRKAYDLYLELGFSEDAERIEEKIGPAPGDP